MKAILVVDIDELPTGCDGCFSLYFNTKYDPDKYYFSCEAAKRGLSRDCEEKRPNWCPLKLPLYIEPLTADDAKRLKSLNLNVDYHDGYVTGWDDCLKNIMGDRNGEDDINTGQDA